MNSFLKRTVSGVVLVAVMVAAILYSVHSLFVLALILTASALIEFFRLVYPEKNSRGKQMNVLLPVVLGVGVVSLAFGVMWYGLSPEWFLAVFPAIFLLFVAQLYRKEGSPSKRIAAELMGIIYVVVPMSLLLALGIQSGIEAPLYNGWLVLFFVILIWINDVGAYLVGVSIGKHRLFERISPKKSWEGFFGGLLFTVLGAIFLGPRMTGFENTPLWTWIIFGVVLTLSAVAGDLVESMLKREAGVKDSGSIIPGHGGILDRFDAMLFALPFVYLLVRLMA